MDFVSNFLERMRREDDLVRNQAMAAKKFLPAPENQKSRWRGFQLPPKHTTEEGYRKAQEASGLKVGDKVRLISEDRISLKYLDHTYGWDFTWTGHHYDKYRKEIMIITDMCSSDTVIVTCINGTDRFFVPYYILEVLEEK